MVYADVYAFVLFEYPFTLYIVVHVPVAFIQVNLPIKSSYVESLHVAVSVSVRVKLLVVVSYVNNDPYK